MDSINGQIGREKEMRKTQTDKKIDERKKIEQKEKGREEAEAELLHQDVPPKDNVVEAMDDRWATPSIIFFKKFNTKRLQLTH